MTHVQLTVKEQVLLQQVLQSSLAMLEMEIVHTDHSEFKAMLKHRRDVLRGLLERIPLPAHASR